MRAVLIATGYSENHKPLVDRLPSHVFPVVGKPFVQHVIEYLVRNDFLEIDIFLCHFPEKTEELLQDGSRWGCKIRYHLLKESDGTLARLKNVSRNWKEDKVFIGACDTLPEIDWDLDIADELWLQMPKAQSRNEWTGWAFVRTERLRNLDQGGEWLDVAQHWEGPEENLPAAHRVLTLLDIRNWASLREAEKQLLEGRFEGVVPSGREVEPGVWLNRNVALHPTCRIDTPIFIDQDCNIGAGVQLLAGSVVAQGCIIAEQTTIHDATIWPHTYIGPGLEISNAIVDRNYLVQIQENVAVALSEQFLLGSLEEGSLLKSTARMLEQILALVLMVGLAPLLLLCGILLKLSRSGPVFRTREIVRLPGYSDPYTWKTVPITEFALRGIEDSRLSLMERIIIRLRLERLPAFLDVAAGRISLVGVAPRTKEEVINMPMDWRMIYLQNRAGLAPITEVQRRRNLSLDEMYTCETYYSIHRNMWLNARTFLHWLFGPRPRLD